jgi:hypothetical protein
MSTFMYRLAHVPLGVPLVKTPNYRQEKKRREDAQKKRTEQEQQRKLARKEAPPALTPR